MQSPVQTFQRWRTLQTNHIHALPIVILMPHSACNCKCVMCDIWKSNKNLKQLSEKDILPLICSLKKFRTQEIVMSGGEALLNANFFSLCEALKKIKVKITLLSTGLTLAKHAEKIVEFTDNIIVSLDGDEAMHDSIRNIPGAYQKMKEGIQCIKKIAPTFPVTSRTVIHKLNFKTWENIINTAKELSLNQVSFLPADISSHAFNREVLWDENRQHEILPEQNDLHKLQQITEEIITLFTEDIQRKFIAETADKLRNIYFYYAAFYGLNPFPYKRCNAPWVSSVIEADGNVRPCFFHESFGNIHNLKFEEIINSKEAVAFRKSLSTQTNTTCVKCVCYLNLPVNKSLL